MTLTRLRNVLLALALTGLAACGGGSSDPSVATSSAGTVGVSLTDAPGDFLSYIVNVVSIQLTRADGTVVETLPATTQVDFTQLVNLSQLITAAAVPPGSYTSVSLTLDYANASIQIDNGTQTPTTVSASNILNGGVAGTPPLVSPNSQVTLTLALPAGQPLVVNRGTVSHLALDFNLAVSNTLSAGSISASTTVTVNPTLSASLAPDATKSMQVRGGFVSADTNASTYTVHVRPFFRNSGSYGTFVVNTTATTVFQINGTSNTGAAGLSALSALTADTMTLAAGTYDVATQTFTATAVYAGSSIPGAGLDSVEGTVVARSGNVLTVANGDVCDRDHDGVSFSRSVSVTVGDGTTVAEDGQAGSFTAQSISVGQHAQFFGTLATDGSGNKTLDATVTGGSARLQVTGLWGLYTSTAAGIVTLNLQALDGHKPTDFNFAGTGTTGNDAQASAYTVGVPAGLSLGGLTAGLPVRFFGFVNAFGAAPPAFNAVSLVNFAATNARLGIEFTFPGGSTAPFVTPIGSTLVLTQGTLQATNESRLSIGPQRVDLKAAAPVAGLTLQANAAASSTGYVIGHWKSRKSDNYTSFADLVTAVNADLNGTTAVLGIGGDGPYDATTSVLSATHLFIVLND